MTNNLVVSRITLFSNDMDRTAEFYNAIGFNLQKSGSWSGRYNYLDIIKHCGQDIIFEIYPSDIVVTPQGLGFDVENVPETLWKLIEFGSEIIRPGNPRVYPHAIIAAVRDPDGRTVTITQHGKVNVKPA